eukprot:4589018-Pleurochrysis_carterae.AAC.2
MVCIFLDAPGGTGKIYTFNTILTALRSKSQIALAVAPRGIAATLLNNGRPFHSRCMPPWEPNEEGMTFERSYRSSNTVIELQLLPLLSHSRHSGRTLKLSTLRATCEWCSSAAAANKDASALQLHAQWLLDVGDGVLNDSNDCLTIPPHLCLPAFSPFSTFLEWVMPSLAQHLHYPQWIAERAMLAPHITLMLMKLTV